MSEEREEMPEWAKELADSIEEIKKRLPKDDKPKEPDFSEFRERLKFRGLIPEDK